MVISESFVLSSNGRIVKVSPDSRNSRRVFLRYFMFFQGGSGDEKKHNFNAHGRFAGFGLCICFS